MLTRNCIYLTKYVCNHAVKYKYEKSTSDVIIRNLRHFSLFLKLEYKVNKRNISWTKCLRKDEKADDSNVNSENLKNNNETNINERPVLEVISQSITENKVVLENVKEKSLHLDADPKVLQESDGKTEGDAEKKATVKLPLKKRKRVDLSAQSLERNFITPVKAMSDFLLKPSDLESLPKTKRRSPYESEPPITVYWRKDVEAKSLEIWGSMENLQKELLKRDIQRKRYQQNIFTVKRRLRDYRREMGKSADIIEQESGLMGRSGKVVLTAVAM